MPGTHPAILIVLALLALAAPTRGLAQHPEAAEEATSEWQFAVRAVDWKAVERLRDEVRDYRAAGAIGPYELRIRPNGTRFDAVVEAEIVDANKLAELRGLDTAGARGTPEESVSRDPPRRASS